MDSDEPNTLIEHFSVLEDPRDPSKCRHKLSDMIVIAIAAVLCGADDLVNVEAFGKAKIDWFRRFLELDNGIPSHDTFGRVFALLSPKAFQASFRAWIESVRTVYEDEVIAVDGKTLRRSHDRKAGLGPLHIVSAWATRNGLVLGQQATEAKSNEITAIPELLEVLMIKGCIVTIDAMGCQKKIAQQIVGQGGDYVLALKGNQGKLADEVEEAFIDADAKDYKDMATDRYETSERGHGRVETRRYWTLGNLDGVNEAKHWANLDMIGMVHSERDCDGKTSSEYRFYIGSIGTDAKRFTNAVRSHWGGRTTCTGASTLPSARTSRASASAISPRTPPYCVTSPSACSRPTSARRPASRPNASRPVGKKPTSLSCCLDTTVVEEH